MTGCFTPAGYSSTVYSYKRPGEIDKIPAQPLWITVLVWEHLRNCMGTSAQLYGNICATKNAVWEHLRSLTRAYVYMGTSAQERMGTSAQPDQGIKKAPTRGAHLRMDTNLAATVAAFSQLRERSLRQLLRLLRLQYQHLAKPELRLEWQLLILAENRRGFDCL